MRKRYHPLLTPYQRLLASDRIDEAVKRHLREQFAALDPVALLTTIRAAQQELSILSNRDTGAVGFAEQPEYLAAFAAAWHSDYRAPQGRRKTTAKHWWRTRTDPFAESWPLVQGWLVAEPNLAAGELLMRLRQRLPDLFPTGRSFGPCSGGLKPGVQRGPGSWCLPRLLRNAPAGATSDVAAYAAQL